MLPGAIAHAVEEVAQAARRLANGTLADFSRAMRALGEGRLEDAHARVDVLPVVVHSRDELATMADSFNVMQERDHPGRARPGRSAGRACGTSTCAEARMAELRESRERFEVCGPGVA